MLQKLSRPLDGAKQSTPRMRDPAARRFEEGHRLLIVSSCLFSYTPWHSALPAGRLHNNPTGSRSEIIYIVLQQLIRIIGSSSENSCR